MSQSASQAAVCSGCHGKLSGVAVPALVSDARVLEQQMLALRQEGGNSAMHRLINAYDEAQIRGIAEALASQRRRQQASERKLLDGLREQARQMEQLSAQARAARELAEQQLNAKIAELRSTDKEHDAQIARQIQRLKEEAEQRREAEKEAALKRHKALEEKMRVVQEEKGKVKSTLEKEKEKLLHCQQAT